MKYPWFRFYPEALDDVKMMRVARAAGVLKVIVLGAWVGLLSLASDSPERGRLLISENMPLVIDEMADKIGIDVPTLNKVIEALMSLDMLQWEEDVLVVINWGIRQPNSDHSRKRVRKHREQKQCDGNGDVTPTECYSNGDVTPTECYSNAIEGEKEEEKEEDSDTEEALLSASADYRAPPDPLELTIAEIKRLDLSIKQWQHVQELEKGGKGRRGALKFIRLQINPPAPALQAYRAIAQTTPVQVLCDDIVEVVGVLPDDVEFWQEVVKGYIAQGWNKFNIANMLDFYSRREIPPGDGRGAAPIASTIPKRLKPTDHNTPDEATRKMQRHALTQHRAWRTAVAVAESAGEVPPPREDFYAIGSLG